MPTCRRRAWRGSTTCSRGPEQTTRKGPAGGAIQGARSGIIELHNYENDHDHEWEVKSECEKVRIVSITFDTEGGFDHVTIGDQKYSGCMNIDQVVDGTFTVGFSSDGSITKSGFVLGWTCALESKSLDNCDVPDQGDDAWLAGTIVIVVII